MPKHLRAPLWHWMYNQCLLNRDALKALGVHMRWELPEPDLADYFAGTNAWIRAQCDDPHFMLETLDALLRLRLYRSGTLAQLDDLLEDANSIYRVRDDNDGLELRVLTEVKSQVQAVVDAADEAPAGHLRDAWSNAYAFSADPAKAYSEAIKAVEAAGAPVISPRNTKATLGTMIRDFDSKPAKWGFVIGGGSVDGAALVRDMMKKLWDGQTSRHGGAANRPETIEESRAGVHLAATLVQFFVGKSFA